MDLARRFKSKKFMWDGKEYPDKKAALETSQKYKSDGFETEVFEEGGKFFVFTRRVVKEIIVTEGQPI